MFENQVLETIKKYNLIESGDRIVLGISGGPDSISMLNVLYKLKEELNIKIYVAHINHGLRENAKLDEKYVEKFCEEKSIEFYCLHANVGKLAQESKRGLEEVGRDVRYKFYDEVLEKVGANKVAIAHNMNDNAETIIMNIVRGAGIAGLKGIEPINGKYIRPLIEVKREVIEEYCLENNLNPRHDESNDDNIYTRNKIRNVVIPYIIKELNPNIIETINRLSKIAKDDIDYLKLQTEKEYESLVIEEKLDVYNKQKKATIILDLKKFNNAEKAIQKRVILLSINKIFGSTKGIESVHIDDMIKLCNNNIGNKYLTPNKNTKIVIKNKKIYIEGVK